MTDSGLHLRGAGDYFFMVYKESLIETMPAKNKTIKGVLRTEISDIKSEDKKKTIQKIVEQMPNDIITLPSLSLRLKTSLLPSFIVNHPLKVTNLIIH